LFSTMQIFLFYCVIEAGQTIRLLPPWNSKAVKDILKNGKNWI
jgi:hypothetical protein